MATGDELLMLVDVSPPPSFAATVFPLDLEGVPAQASRGDSVTVTVVEYRLATGAPGEGTRTPVAGATISGAGATATSGADGKATLHLEQTGRSRSRPRPGQRPVGAASSCPCSRRVRR